MYYNRVKEVIQMKLGKMLQSAREDNELTMDELTARLNKKYNLRINKGIDRHFYFNQI